MAQQEKNPTPATAPDSAVVDLASIGKVIADGIAAGIAQTMPKKVPFGQYDPKSPFHPEKKKSLKLTRACYQNGAVLDPEKLFDSEIMLLNKINKSGRYIDRKVEVILRQDVDSDVVEIRYNNQTHDQRSDLKTLCRNFEHMLQQIVEAQEANAAKTMSLR